MIEPATLKSQLTGLSTRSNQKHTAEAWGTGDIGVPDDLLPDVNENVRQTLQRLARQAQSLGPRIVSIKRFGTLGDINWGGENTQADERIRGADLETVADELLEQGLYSGILAGIVRRDPDSGEVRVEPLLGHVEPIYSPASPTLVAGILHAWSEQVNGRAVWSVRVYDLRDRTMLEWTNLSEPKDIEKREPTLVGPSVEYPAGAPVPRFAIVSKDRDRMPKGEMAKLLPLLFADWSSQVRGSRIEESTAIPQLVVRGEVEDGTNERSPAHVIRLIEDGDAKYLVPGDMTTLHEQHNRVLERVREDGNLPGGFLGSQTPSGEALREANAKFISANRYYAARLGRVLTELAADLLTADGIAGEAPIVTVTINREFTKAQDITDTIALYREDLLEHGAAVRHITPFVPTWDDEDVEAFIQERREVVPPEPTPASLAESS